MKTQELVDQFMANCQAKNLAGPTIDTYDWVMSKLLATYPDDLPETAGELRQVLIDNAYLAPTSLLTIYKRLEIMWSWAEEQGICPNTMRYLDQPVVRKQLPRYLEKEEVGRLLDVAANDRDYTILAALLDTGMRIGELASMEKKDLGETGVRVRGKTGDRVVPVTPSVAKLIAKQGDDRGMWIGLQGRLTVWGLQQAVNRTMKTRRARRAEVGTASLPPHLCRPVPPERRRRGVASEHDGTQ